MKKIFLNTAFTFLFAFSSLAHDGNWTASRPDGHGPISVMGDHMHEMGEWMLSYRYMTMKMEGLLDGSSNVTAMAANAKYGFNAMMLPKEMTMDMHMFGAMHAADADRKKRREGVLSPNRAQHRRAVAAVRRPPKVQEHRDGR